MKPYYSFLERDRLLENISNSFELHDKTANMGMFLWANPFGLSRTLSSDDAMLQYLLNESIPLEPALRSLVNNAIYHAETKFGGSAPYTSKLFHRLLSQLSRQYQLGNIKLAQPHEIQDTNISFFESTLPRLLSPYALPNDFTGFQESLKFLERSCSKDVVEAVRETVLRSGSGGNIILQASKHMNDFVIEQKSGFRFTTFNKSALFEHTTNRNSWAHQKVKLLIVDGGIEEVYEIDQILNKAFESKQPIAILAHRFGEDVISTAVANAEQHIIDIILLSPQNDVKALNTLIDVGIVAGSVPITPFTVHSEFLLASWDELPTVEEMIVSTDGTVTIRNPSTQHSVSQQLAVLIKRRSELTFDNFEKEKILTARINNLTSSPTFLYYPEKTSLEGERTRLSIDTALRFMKAVISYGLVDCTNLTYDKAHVPEINSWMYEEVLQTIKEHKVLPYAHVIGATRIVLNTVLTIADAGGVLKLQHH